ncbi:hypothetical protein BT96DRAFT_377374 [Gymnopus androsaceus JB14]|uniref:Uncharacterized protein n=1 Tax=Gymnopus androsaceus JB14 TaxID=1447944 RepID=A0A6A4IIQ7_9AGAR|nr:hypothetical protein BT96DRAFT_377374 [Gymnopus androsaceus JB14]
MTFPDPDDASFFQRIYELNEQRGNRTRHRSTSRGYLVGKKRQRRAIVDGEDDRYTRTPNEQRHERVRAKERCRAYCEELLLERLRCGSVLPRSVQEDLGWVEEEIDMIFNIEEDNEREESNADAERGPADGRNPVPRVFCVLLVFIGLSWLFRLN